MFGKKKFFFRLYHLLARKQEFAYSESRYIVDRLAIKNFAFNNQKVEFSII